MRVAIAGAGRGIGAACARALRGSELFVCARTAEEVHAVAAEAGAHPIVADLATDAGAVALAVPARGWVGSIDTRALGALPVFVAPALRRLGVGALVVDGAELAYLLEPDLLAAALAARGAV